MLATVMGLWHAVLFILETQKRTALWAEFLHSIVPDNQYWFFQAKFCGMYMVHSKVFCQYCCDVIWFIRIAIVPWTWSSFAECCYGGLLNVVTWLSQAKPLVCLPTSHGLDTRGFTVVRWLVPVFNWRKHLQSWQKLHLASWVGRSDTLGSLLLHWQLWRRYRTYQILQSISNSYCWKSNSSTWLFIYLGHLWLHYMHILWPQ